MYDTAPSLGADNVRNGIWAGLLALALLTVFMCVYYFRAGVIACLALAVNVVLILGAMAAFGATMTMPGIAGVILPLGMALDANVLFFDRIREELNGGKSLAAAARTTASRRLAGCQMRCHCRFIIGRGFPFGHGDGSGGTGRQTIPQPVTVVLPHEPGLAVHHVDGALMARLGTGPAAVALVQV